MTKGLELSGNALKVIAIIAMTIDHLAWVGIETYEQAETPLQIFLHIIGSPCYRIFRTCAVIDRQLSQIFQLLPRHVARISCITV